MHTRQKLKSLFQLITYYYLVYNEIIFLINKIKIYLGEVVQQNSLF